MSKPTNVTAIWPDGTEQVVSIYRVHGMKRKMPDGKIVRPVFRYDFDLEAVEPPSARENLRRDLRKIGAFPKGQTEWAKAAEAKTACEPVTEWAGGRPVGGRYRTGSESVETELACEVCGAAATVATVDECDVSFADPHAGHRFGGAHYWCDEHAPEAI